jgi:Arc/MetJ-type ribon-helix-helix transcriptional regulator
MIQYCVCRRDDRWMLDQMGSKGNHAYGPFSSRDEAIRNAMELARRESGDREVLIPTDDGRGSRALWKSSRDGPDPPEW